MYFSDTDCVTWTEPFPRVGVTFYTDVKYSSRVETGSFSWTMMLVNAKMCFSILMVVVWLYNYVHVYLVLVLSPRLRLIKNCVLKAREAFPRACQVKVKMTPLIYLSIHNEHHFCITYSLHHLTYLIGHYSKNRWQNDWKLWKTWHGGVQAEFVDTS